MVYKLVQAQLSLYAALITFALGGCSALIKTLVAMVILDYLTGVITAAYQGKLNSEIGVKGIARKLLIFVLVAVAHLLDGVLELECVVQNTVIYFYISNEIISILENCIKLGLPVPKIIVKLCDEMRNDSLFHTIYDNKKTDE